MKSIFRYMVAGIIFILPITAFTEPLPDGGSVQRPQDDTEKLREQVNSLVKVFDKQQSHTTTTADVVDKALTLISSGARQVAAGLEKAAPELFKVLLRQQRIKALTSLFFPLGLIIIVLLSQWYSTKLWSIKNGFYDKYKYKDELIARYLIIKLAPFLLVCAFSIWFLSNASDSIGYLLNPEFYAIQDFVKLIVDPKSIQ